MENIIIPVGTKVCYIPYSGCPEGSMENGVVKGDGGYGYLFVVYKCNDDWKNYNDYTGQRTAITDLKIGWK